MLILVWFLVHVVIAVSTVCCFDMFHLMIVFSFQCFVLFHQTSEDHC